MSLPAYVDATLALRSSHPQVPAREVLDVVMQGQSAAEDSPASPWFEPSHPFAATVCEAFDRVMSIAEWRIMTAPIQPHRVAMLEVWRDQVVALFLARYDGKLLEDQHTEDSAEQAPQFRRTRTF